MSIHYQKLRKWRYDLFLAVALGFCLSFQTVLAESPVEEEPVYVENEWNFADGSMDVSQGIPEDALGRLGMIRERGRLTVATEPYYPPQEFIDESASGQDQYVGADMELARRIAERMGVELEIVPLPFSEVIDRVAEGKYDLAISALAFTEGRAALLEMSKGYYFTDEVISGGLLIKADRQEEIRGIEDLKNLDIVAQSRSLQESMAADAVSLYHQFLRTESVAEVFEAVENGTADAGIVDASPAAQYISSHPDNGLMFVPVSEFSLREEFRGDRVAAPKGEIQLIYFVNGVIDEILASDQYNLWIRQYSAE